MCKMTKNSFNFNISIICLKKEETELIELIAELRSVKTKKESKGVNVKSRLIYLSAIRLMNSSSRPSWFCLCLQCFNINS